MAEHAGGEGAEPEALGVGGFGVGAGEFFVDEVVERRFENAVHDGEDVFAVDDEAVLGAFLGVADFAAVEERLLFIEPELVGGGVGVEVAH